VLTTALIIPARYESSRFPGKPLAIISDKSMLQRVWEQSIQAISEQDVYVATDDERIVSHCRHVGMQYIMTDATCMTGTDRVYQASKQIDADIYINVQGDEPLVEPSDIRRVMDAARNSPDKIINAMCPIDEEADFRNPSVPKVVVDPDGRLLYMSRSPIPTNKNHGFQSAMKQVCIYAFPKSALEQFASVKQKTPMEAIEDIEIIRFLEIGREVQMISVSTASIAVDFPDDVRRVEEALRAQAQTV